MSSEIWGVFDRKGGVRAMWLTKENIGIAAELADQYTPSGAPHRLSRLYTAAEVRAILHDMPEAAARFEDSK